MISTRLSLALLLVTVLSLSLNAQEPASLPLLTPRPSAVADVASPLMSLNGVWLFRPDSLAIAARLAGDSSAGWTPIPVPAEWVMQSYQVKPGTFAVYRRVFDLPVDWTGKMIKLRFDGVHSVCRVWANGSEVGEHEGGFTVFEFDVTKRLKAGSNSITVAVKSESVSDTLASASQYAAHPLGGITRKVTLFAVPEVHVSSLVTNTVFDSKFRHADLKIELDLLNESMQASTPADIAFELIDSIGEKEPRATATATVGALPPGQSARRSISIRVPNVKKWDPEHPNLYLLRAHLRENGRTTETVTQRIGFRQVAVKGNRVFVNGQPIKLHGVNRHEVHPTLGRSLTSEQWRRDAEIFREANVNYIRTSHYPPAEEFLDACDELGLFVECEAALCWVQHGANEKWKEWDYRSKKFLPHLLRANLENVVANRHHPSIIIWSLANESYWSPSFAEVHEAVRRADPSRLTSFHDQCWGKYNNGGSKAQVAVYHYPDEKSPEQCNKEPRPVLFGEYTHIETYNRKENVTDPGIRDHWGVAFERMYELVYRNPGCLGGAIWAGIDEVFVLPGGHATGYGPWGIFDGWRRLKPEYWHVKKSYSPVKVVDPRTPRSLRNGAFHLSLENRYDFTNLSEVGIEWSIGNERGKASTAIGPHKNGTLIVRPTQPPPPGEKLTLTFTDPRGFVCETEKLTTGPAQALRIPPESNIPVTSLDSTDSGYIVKGKGYVCEIEKSTGRIQVRDVQGKQLLIGGPALMILPLSSQENEAGPNYRADSPVLNNACTQWRQGAIQAAVMKSGSAKIVSNGTYAEAEGSCTLTFHGDGEMVLEYSFRVVQDVNPRQWGMVLYVPPDLDSLSWHREGQWSIYPTSHIGRPAGSAVARPRQRVVANPPQVALGEWSGDANELGTNDFRSTKSHVRSASLQCADGRGISLPDVWPHAVRAFVDGEKIGLLLAGFNTGGADQFFAMHYAAERKPLTKGEIISGRSRVRFIHN